MNGIFAIDVDSVVAELGTAWLNRYNKDYNDTLTHNDILSWDTHLYVKPECGKKIYEYLEDPTLYDEVLPVPYAQDGVRFISYQGYRIIYVTNSTLGASGAKYKWLEGYGFITGLDDYIECKDKSLIRADYLLDDRYQNVMSFRGKRGILYDRPWNKEYFYAYRLKDWSDIYEAKKRLGF